MSILGDFTKKYGSCSKGEASGSAGAQARGMTSSVHMKDGGRMGKAEGERIPPVKAYAAGGIASSGTPGGTPSSIPMKKGCRVPKK